MFNELLVMEEAHATKSTKRAESHMRELKLRCSFIGEAIDDIGDDACDRGNTGGWIFKLRHE